MAHFDSSGYQYGRSSFYQQPTSSTLAYGRDYREWKSHLLLFLLLPPVPLLNKLINLFSDPLFPGGPSESASVNMLSDDFIHGYPHEGRMSAVRRFFCLFVTFDVLFIGFLWIISVVVKWFCGIIIKGLDF